MNSVNMNAIMRVLKFLIAGGTGAGVNLSLFHVLYILGVPYLLGSVIAVLFAMIVGFLLQKYWTFGERVSDRISSQFTQYATLAIGNLIINTGIVYLLIGKLGVYYLLAQAIAAGMVASYSFFVYRAIIFRPNEDNRKSIQV